MSKKIESLSVQQARKLVLLSQRVLASIQNAGGKEATLSAIEHLGYIQIDTISAIERAHNHTLWNRNPNYKNSHLDKLIAEKQVLEYWSHAAAYLPMRDYRYTLVRKLAIANGNDNHWYKRDEKMMKWVLKRIADEGPLMAKDFENRIKKSGEWETKPSKQALGNLFMQGDLMISSRVNFHKVYDLTERVIPGNIDTTIPSHDEYARFLIKRFLQANGLGQTSEIAYLLKNTKAIVNKALQKMLSNGELLEINAAQNNYYALTESLELLNKPLALSKLKILSPFDNLLIQRKRMKTIFNFDYLIECYLPQSKRKYGYFSLPILWDGKLVARMDCKVERKQSLLHINHLALEPSLTKIDAFFQALLKELELFLEFNNCSHIILHKTTPTVYKQNFENLINSTIN